MKGQRVRARDSSWGMGWLVKSLGFLLLLFGGFGVGLVVGFVLEEPTLVAGHIAGRTAVIDWGPERAGELAIPGVGLGAETESLAPVGAGPPLASRRASSEPGFFSIQVGAFGDAKLATSLAERLRSTGYPAEVIEPRVDDRWRVRVGPLDERGTAEEMARRLKRENRLPTWILRESVE